jgi:hypothetical protein
MGRANIDDAVDAKPPWQHSALDLHVERYGQPAGIRRNP